MQTTLTALSLRPRLEQPEDAMLAVSSINYRHEMQIMKKMQFHYRSYVIVRTLGKVLGHIHILSISTIIGTTYCAPLNKKAVSRYNERSLKIKTISNMHKE